MPLPSRMRPAWKAALAIGAVTLLTGALRFVHLGQPDRKVFDEVYYASDGCWYAGLPYRSCGLEADLESTQVHPPLGKQVIALGVIAFGNEPFGWRVAAAAAGTATVALAGTLAYLLLSSAVWGGVGALLAGTEHLLLVQSRIAMLDVFLALFVVLGFVLLVLDRRRLDHRTVNGPKDRPPPAIRGWRPLLLLAGAAFGAAVAVKWSGVLALLGAIVLAVGWAWSRQRSSGSPRPVLSALRDEGPVLWLGLLAVPLVAYSLTWLPWLADRGFDVGEWITHHRWMLDYHLGLDTVKENGEPIHPYMSRAWSWFLVLRPVSYFWRGDPCCAEILGLGHPLLFWGSLLTLPYLALVWRRRRDWTAGAILVPVLSQFVPWLIISRPLFLFYMTPVTPFLAVAMTFVLRDISTARLDRRITVPAIAVVVAACVGAFAFFWPVLTANPISREAWSARIWLDGWV